MKNNSNTEDQNIEPSKIEAKWQKKWADNGTYSVDFDNAKDKYYNLTMFPYPSGDKLHIGHWYNYAPHDSWGRYMRMKGKNVFQPMGFDAFGLPAENYAIKTGVHPNESTAKNVETMITQLKRIGCMYDWDKMVNTSTPEYYKWTQWLFLQMYKNGLAYRKKATVNYCPSCQTVLANEQVWDGHCERCKSEVKQKDLEQWFWKTTEYAQRLLDNLDKLDWPEKTKTMQRNWIGRSEGVNIDFPLEDGSAILTCYTTRPDTLFSVTFVVIAAEHPLVEKLSKGTEHEAEVQKAVAEIKAQTDIERTSEGGKDKLGAFLGKYAINPATGEKIPVYVANFVLMYGTGVVMADAHDQRDFEFARKYDIDLKFVISEDGKEISPDDYDSAFVEDGILFNSGDFTGMNNREALPKMAEWMEQKGFGKRTINYKLRDWLLSRQRYWGSPIPIVYCEKCGTVPLPEDQLPVLLPEDVEYKPSGGEVAPLATSETFVNTKCPECDGDARREVDTMDTFVCSSWYQFRYLDNKNAEKPWEKKRADDWMPVDMYIGGPEHACMHLIYARFVTMALHEWGYCTHDEPFQKLVHQGLVTKDGAKMSKSKGNVVSPDAFVEKYGSDVFRMYLMFMGPYTDGGDWNDQGITGISRFYRKFWNAVSTAGESKAPEQMKQIVHQTIQHVTRSLNSMHFNTAIAGLMEAVNKLAGIGLDKEHAKMFIQLIAPLAPHLAEELWEASGEKSTIFDSKWPSYDEDLLQVSEIEIAVQVNGKVRGTFTAPAEIENDEAFVKAMAVENVQKYLDGKEIVKKFFVAGKLVSFVVK